MSKNGLFTLNRWMGRKNKDKTPNGKLSKSSTNLSLSDSTADINETSQLEYNRITGHNNQLPAITTNAFEQMFRITVLLPKDQLYVKRLGARVPLSKLMELVCENKLLDSSKYEFRHPVDPSQVFSCDLTIGTVGLSELRLCHKSDSYDTYSTDDVIKMNRTSLMRESLSSSEYSNRNFKHTTKSASPYSSSNSLNSVDSTGMNYSRSPISSTAPSLPSTEPPKMTAPPRKKRAAPRPPQPIPERAPLVIENGNSDHTIESLKAANIGLPRKDYYVSTPNLTSPTSLTPEAYNLSMKENEQNGNSIANSVDIQAEVEQKNARNLHTGSVQNLSIVNESKLPEPSPRKRLIQIKKKSAPAPPPRSLSQLGDDNISLHSQASSTLECPSTPVTASPTSCDKFGASVREQPSDVYHNGTVQALNHEIVASTPPAPLKASTPVLDTNKSDQICTDENKPIIEPPKPVPRVTTTTTIKSADVEEVRVPQSTNVSKVLLNRTPTPEPRSLSTEPPDVEVPYGEHNDAHSGFEDDDNVSKQADSGIGEPVPSPIPDSLPSESSLQENKSTFESSSDDDDVKVYNFKLGKTVSKPYGEHKTLDDLTIIASGSSAPDSGENTPATVTHEITPSISETSSWNFSIPISPPPNFADISQAEKSESNLKHPDAPITPKIKERPVLNFDVITHDKTQASIALDNRNNNQINCNKKESEKMRKVTPLQSPTTPLNEIVDELTAIINDNRIDTLIRKPDDDQYIEAAKPNTLSNFRISSNSQQIQRPLEIYSNQSKVNIPTDEVASQIETNSQELPQSELKEVKQSNAVIRAESFHSTATKSIVAPQSTEETPNNALNSRSSSHLSLSKLDQNGLNLNRRRSSSELSIGESPSLQSLEVIKTILNSRKNSLASGSEEDTKSSGRDTEVDNGKCSILKETQISRVELRPKIDMETKVSRVELRPKTEVISSLDTEQRTTSANNESETPKNPSKMYRYTGPPSINFSTWSERPKVQVAIKNEGDYIFGGQNAGNQHAAVTTAAMDVHSKTIPRSFRSQSTAFTSHNEHATQPPAVAPKPTSIVKRMGIPEKEYRVPVTVKPLQDYVVQNDRQPDSLNMKLNRVTTIESTSSRPLSLATNTSTLPRVSEKNLNKTFIVRTPSIVDQVTLRAPVKVQVNSSEATPRAAPFGQNTLRKTGLKEKILAAEDKEVERQKANEKKTTSVERNLTNGNVEGSVVQKFVSQNSQAQSIPKFQSAKLEIKLKKSTSVNVPLYAACSTEKLKTPPSAPAAPVAPPPPPNGTFQKGPAKSISASDPRDQLLDAIRNFKREELNRI